MPVRLRQIFKIDVITMLQKLKKMHSQINTTLFAFSHWQSRKECFNGLILKERMLPWAREPVLDHYGWILLVRQSQNGLFFKTVLPRPGFKGPAGEHLSWLKCTISEKSVV